MEESEMRTLLVRIDERQQTLLTEFKDHKAATEKDIKHIQRVINDAKVGFRVLGFLASIGAVAMIQWEALKGFVHWITGKDS